MEKMIVDKRGYLNRDYMLFHLCDKQELEVDYHYHEFDKIIIMLSGNVSYHIEGKEYHLDPYDILIVNHHQIHKPIVDASVPYDRVVLWVNHAYIKAHSTETEDLGFCFSAVAKRQMNLLHIPDDLKPLFHSCVTELSDAFTSTDFAAGMLSNSCFIRLLIHINRLALADEYFGDLRLVTYDRKIDDIINYINANVDADLSIEALARRFFISKSYLMHRFKSETGYSLHSYVCQKRLLHAKQLLQTGTPITEAALNSGFKDYSTFLRAFKKLFGELPSEYLSE